MKKIGEYIITEALFKKDGVPDLGLNEEEDELETTPFRFKLSSLESWNSESETRPTTIRLSNGDSFNINVPFKEFDKFILENKES